ncbi:MAG: L-ribulose-5-phosphate 3-epimerase [Succinivibrio sp.]|nr:L-ribulose-5-phosphate 3-epimerase [Succinivibrio sp.]
MKAHPLGLYEKALPASFSFEERFKTAQECGFDYLEISVDESDERLKRLDWTVRQRKDFVNLKLDLGMRVPSMCLSAHRRFPFGSHDPAVRQKARDIMSKAIDLASDIGVRTIQLAGYDVYYEDSDESTVANYAEGMQWSTRQAAAAQVTIATEIMDTPFQGTISKWKVYDELIKSPWFCVYPDVGNLSAWTGGDIEKELSIGMDKISALHLKETLFVKPDRKGQFRDLQFGDGDMDFKKVFSILKKLNYRGSFVLEMWGDKEADPVGNIRRAISFIRDKMAQADF